jgi:parvulin-like peptidyl-prolyl isomerase
MMKILSLLVLFSFLRSQAEVVDRIFAVVNNEVILQSDRTRLEKKAAKPALIEEILLDGRPASDLRKDSSLQTEYLIREKVMDSEIKRLNLVANPERVEQEIKNMAQRYNTTPENIEMAARTEMGLTDQEYKKFLKSQIERQSLIEQDVTSKVRVTDEEVFEEYKKRAPRSGSSISEVTLAQIFLNPRKGGEDSARARAEAALRRVRSGESFESVAEQTSEDPNFSNGGLLGSFKSGELNPEFEVAISNLKKGQTSEVFSSKRGFHILKVLDLKVIQDPQFLKEKDRIRSFLMERAFEKQFRSWLKKKREEATVTINDGT